MQTPLVFCNCNRPENPTKSYFFYNQKQYDATCLNCNAPYQYILPENTMVRILSQEKLNPDYPPDFRFPMNTQKYEQCNQIFPYAYHNNRTQLCDCNYFSNYWLEFGYIDPETQEFIPYPDWFQFTTPHQLTQQEWKPEEPTSIHISNRVINLINQAVYQINPSLHRLHDIVHNKNSYDFTHIDISKTNHQRISGFSFNKLKSLTWQATEYKDKHSLDTQFNRLLQISPEHQRHEHGTFLKPAKLIRALFPDLEDKTITLIASKFAYLLRKNANPDISIVQVNPNPSEIYTHPNQCFDSCMRCQPKSWFKIYDDIQNISIAYIEVDNEIKARALVHESVHDNEHEHAPIKIMDRIYYANEDYLVLMQLWAQKNGYWCKNEQSAGHTKYMTPDGQIIDTYVHHHLDFDLRNKSYEGVPYFDTFYQYDIDAKQLGDDVYDSDTEFRETGGGDENNVIVSGTRCYECECRVDEDDIYYGPDDNVYCKDCYNEYFFVCEDCGETTWRDYSRYVDGEDIYVCEYCFDNYYRRCEGCHTEYHRDNLTYDDETNEYYCEVCYEKLIEEREKEEESEESEQE